MNCYFSYNIIIEGILEGYVRPSSCIRWGDQLSLVTLYIHHMPEITGISLCQLRQEKDIGIQASKDDLYSDIILLMVVRLGCPLRTS